MKTFMLVQMELHSLEFLEVIGITNGITLFTLNNYS